MADGPLQTYRNRVERGEIAFDTAQEAAAARLDRLAAALEASEPRLLRTLVGLRTPPPRGIYIHGAVGRGKTMLMDLFFDAAPVKLKRRVHFHAFMAEVHDLMRQARLTETVDVIGDVATQIAMRARLLCFDEFAVTDIADAMILGRLFEALLKRGVVIVATSNSAPSELYKNGLKRDNFLPFIALIGEQLDVLELVSPEDYRELDARAEALPANLALYLSPLGEPARQGFEASWSALTHGAAAAEVSLDIKGHALRLHVSGPYVRASFDELCGQNLGAGDYLEIARRFALLALSDVPRLTPADRNAARRMVTLIDTLYDQGRGLIISADGEPSELYPKGDGAEAFLRTASRLTEMRTIAYFRRALTAVSAASKIDAPI